jgi:hypothetical protein
VDTLKNSKYVKMKELRFEAADGVWRLAFAFEMARERQSWSPATSRARARLAFTAL